MKRLTLLFFLMVAAFGTTQAQLLYRISGNGLQRPSYIIGTHHLIDAQFTAQIAGLKEAMEQTEQVYGEVVMTDMMNPDSIKAMQEMSLLPDGKTLRDVMTADQFSRLDHCCHEQLGVKLSSEQLYSALGRMTPSGLSSYLTVMLYMKSHPDVNIQNAIDGWFQSEALRQGKAVGGLESVSFQAELLMQGGTIEEQVSALMCLVDNVDLNIMMLNDITEAYHDQDLESVTAAMNEMSEVECDSSEQENESLLYDRNSRWVEQMPAIMRAHPTLFAVGAAHLTGDRGVLQLLRQAGYTVEGVR
ncbi:MAG: TraB/GumN family protein [Bacteroidales bacterium]|nr:TraB/GumN family protein [Bacteroidales bacterium]